MHSTALACLSSVGMTVPVISRCTLASFISLRDAERFRTFCMDFSARVFVATTCCSAVVSDSSETPSESTSAAARAARLVAARAARSTSTVARAARSTSTAARAARSISSYNRPHVAVSSDLRVTCCSVGSLRGSLRISVCAALSLSRSWESRRLNPTSVLGMEPLSIWSWAADSVMMPPPAGGAVPIAGGAVPIDGAWAGAGGGTVS